MLLAAAAAAAELFGDEAAYAKWKERYPESGFDEKAHDGAPLAGARRGGRRGGRCTAEGGSV